MFDKAMTIFSFIYVIGYILAIGYGLFRWNKLSPFQRAFSNINVNPGGFVAFLATASYLIAKLI